jgi:type IV pilus assembly protein PilN
MIRINLLPIRAERKKESLRHQAIVAALVVIALGGFIAAVHATLSSDIDKKRQDIAQRKIEIARLQTVIGEVKEFRKKKRDLEEKIEVIRRLEGRQRGPVRVLYELARLIPEKMWIEKLKDAGGTLSLEGIAIDNQTIARFMTQMQASPLFEQVRLDVTRQVSRAGVDLKAFSIKTSIVYPKAG